MRGRQSLSQSQRDRRDGSCPQKDLFTSGAAALGCVFLSETTINGTRNTNASVSWRLRRGFLFGLGFVCLLFVFSVVLFPVRRSVYSSVTVCLTLWIVLLQKYLFEIHFIFFGFLSKFPLGNAFIIALL